MSKKFNFNKYTDEIWLSNRSADSLLTAEQQLVNKALPDMHGLFLVQVSALNQSVIERTSLKYCFLIGSSTEAQVITEFAHLPFRSNSVDCTVLHHVLDYSDNPHQCLRDAANITVPNGFLVLVCFNPLSIWGVLRLLRLVPSPSPVSLLLPGRLLDWLAFLGFRVETVTTSQVLPPIIVRYFPRLSRFVDRLCKKIGLPLGMAQVIVARKLVAGRTPIRPQWGRISSKGGSVIAPATRDLPASR